MGRANTFLPFLVLRKRILRGAAVDRRIVRCIMVVVSVFDRLPWRGMDPSLENSEAQLRGHLFGSRGGWVIVGPGFRRLRSNLTIIFKFVYLGIATSFYIIYVGILLYRTYPKYSAGIPHLRDHVDPIIFLRDD